MAAFNSLIRDYIFAAMPYHDIPATLIRLCIITLSNISCTVLVEKDISEPIDVVRDFRHGDFLSCHLFNFAMAWHLIADDRDIIGFIKRGCTVLFNVIERKSSAMGEAVKRAKNKNMLSISSGNPTLEAPNQENYFIVQCHPKSYIWVTYISK